MHFIPVCQRLAAAFQKRSGSASGPYLRPGERGSRLCFSGTVGVLSVLELHCWFCSAPLSLNSLSFPYPPSPPPGIRTEQDFYVRLIDSMTKQVSFLILRREGDSTAAKFGRVKKLAAA